jgi:Flp pilus assembly protein protease CpaA
LILLLDLIRFVPLILILLFASYQDLTRTVKAKFGVAEFECGTVSNRLWFYAPFGLMLTLVELAFYPVLIGLSLVSIVFGVAAAVLLFRFGGWGGGDAKAFMTVAVSAPLVPVWSVLFPLPLPFFVLFLSCGLAVVYGLMKKSRVPFRQRTVRFLPFMFIGLVITLLL